MQREAELRQEVGLMEDYAGDSDRYSSGVSGERGSMASQNSVGAHLRNFVVPAGHMRHIEDSGAFSKRVGGGYQIGWLQALRLDIADLVDVSMQRECSTLRSEIAEAFGTIKAEMAALHQDATSDAGVLLAAVQDLARSGGGGSSAILAGGSPHGKNSGSRAAAAAEALRQKAAQDALQNGSLEVDFSPVLQAIEGEFTSLRREMRDFTPDVKRAMAGIEDRIAEAARAEVDFTPVLQAIDECRAVSDVKPVLAAVEQSTFELARTVEQADPHMGISAVRDQMTNLTQVVAMGHNRRVDVDFSTVITAIHESRPQIDLRPILTNVREQIAEIDFRPVLAAIRENRTELDLDPVLAAIRQSASQAQVDFSAVTATIRESALHITQAVTASQDSAEQRAQWDLSPVLSAIRENKPQLDIRAITAAIRECRAEVDMQPVLQAVGRLDASVMAAVETLLGLRTKLLAEEYPDVLGKLDGIIRTAGRVPANATAQPP